jgi:NAD-dependent dihydropyrimidine dehydrogenase PreA subunit
VIITMSEKLWSKLIQLIGKAGLALPVNDTLIKIMQTIITEEQAKFLQIFRRPTLTIDRIKQKSDLDGPELEAMLNNLMHEGVIISSFNEDSEIMEYNLAPFLPGIFEHTLMRGGISEKEKKLAILYEKLFEELKELVQSNYDIFLPQAKSRSPGTRIVPVEEQVDVKQQIILPYEEITKILEKYDTFGVATCYCRHKQDLIGDPCKLDAPRENCLIFGNYAQHLIEQEFIKPISREDALKTLKESENYGLVHTAFHLPEDPEYNENAICSCCKCCCGTLDLHHRGLTAMNTLSSYLAKVNEEDCVGCGTCVEKCPMEAVELQDTIAAINEDKCIGCGICAHHCPEESMTLNRTGLRNVFVPPPRLINV